MLLGDQFRVFLRQYLQKLLPLFQHARHFAGKTQHLAPHQRQQPQGYAKKRPDKHQKRDGHPKPLWQTVALQLRGQPLYQVGQHQRGENRRQDIADGHQQHHRNGQ